MWDGGPLFFSKFYVFLAKYLLSVKSSPILILICISYIFLSIFSSLQTASDLIITIEYLIWFKLALEPLFYSKIK